MEPHGSPRGFALPVGRGIPAEPGCCHRCQSLHVFWIRSKIPPSAPPCLCEHRPLRPEIAPSRFFHSMENFFLIFPLHGKFRPGFSTRWSLLHNSAKTAGVEPGPPQCPQWPVFSPGGTTSASSGFVLHAAQRFVFSTLWKTPPPSPKHPPPSNYRISGNPMLFRKKIKQRLLAIFRIFSSAIRKPLSGRQSRPCEYWTTRQFGKAFAAQCSKDLRCSSHK